MIKSIIVKSKKYKTKQGIGVGSNLYNIQKTFKINKDTLELKKNELTIGSLVESVVYYF